MLLTEAKEADFKFSITFKKGCTIREAKRELYHNAVALGEQTEVQVKDAQLLSIRIEVKIKKFISECEDQRNSYNSVLASLDIDLPEELFRPPTKATASKATELYKKLIMAVATKLEGERTT